MELNLTSNGNLKSAIKMQEKFESLLGISMVEFVPQGEILAINVLMNALLNSSDRLLIITAEINDLEGKFQFLLNNFNTKYCLEKYDELNLESLELIVKSFKPQVILYDYINFKQEPNWEKLGHFARINGSKLVFSMGEAISLEFANGPELAFKADFITGQWGEGIIMSQFPYGSIIEETQNNLFSKNRNLKLSNVDFVSSIKNAESLVSTLSLNASQMGCIVRIYFQELNDRIENFGQVLRQVGINTKELKLNFNGEKTIELSTFNLTAQGYDKSAFTKIGEVISRSYLSQKSIIELEELRKQVLNIEQNFKNHKYGGSNE